MPNREPVNGILGELDGVSLKFRDAAHGGFMRLSRRFSGRREQMG
jgi:hypothetical protein